MKMNVFLFSAILLCASCSEDEDIIKNEEPMKPNTEKTAGNNGATDNSPAERIFTTNSTVDDVISNPHSVISAICYFQLTAMCQGL